MDSIAPYGNTIVLPPRRFKQFGRLTGKPSQLINLALANLLIAGEHTCGEANIDLADVVMSITLNATSNDTVDIKHFPKESNALKALNYIQLGYLCYAMLALGLGDSLDIGINMFVKITPYTDSPDIFKEDMRELSKQLSQMGY